MTEGKKHILIVDDQPNLRKVLRDLMEHQGFEVSTADNGETGVQIALETKPDLIVMDMMMPVLGGVEATRQIRENPDFGQTPIVFLTARGQAEDEARAREAGATAFINKPFSPRKVMATVQDLLK